MTVNHDVAGSSPAGGVKKSGTHRAPDFFLSCCSNSAASAINSSARSAVREFIFSLHSKGAKTRTASFLLSDSNAVAFGSEPSRGSKKHKTEAFASVCVSFSFALFKPAISESDRPALRRLRMFALANCETKER